VLILGCTNKKEDVEDYFQVTGNPFFNSFNEAINFESIEPQHITSGADAIIERSESVLASIVNTPDDKRVFDNTMRRYDDLLNDLGRIHSVIYLMSKTHPDSTMRNTALQTINQLEQFNNALSLDEGLYTAFKSYEATNEAKELKGYQAKFLTETIEDFERNGFALDSAGRKKLKQIKDDISETGNAFSKNISNHEDYLIVTEEQIDGLPADYKAARKVEGGKYKIDLSYPSYLPFMKYSHSEEARKALYIKFNNRAADQNLEVLRRLLQRRKDMAELLGYGSYAAWQLEDRMAKAPATVWEFEYELLESVKPKADQDYQVLREIKQTKSAGKQEQIMPWSASYYENILLEERYQLDAEKVRAYFPLDGVLEGLFKITQNLFGVKYVEMEDPSVWHTDVRAFEVFDGNKLIGRFYLDLFPRPNKFSHAACFGMIKGKMTKMGYQIPNAALVCNFPAPTDTRPSLLPHDQVETLFHEFGHVLHQILTEANLYSQSGTSVARDFVEAPSQIFENWVWNYESLSLFARHFESGEVLPRPLFDKMLAAKNVNSGLFVEGQIFYGVLDMTLHDKFDPYGEKTTDDIVAELRKEITHYPYIEGTHFQAAFGHLNGYAAGYYGYLWSKVFAEDMFAVFDENGIMDQETGLRYRNIILASGSAQEPMKLVETFLGRKPNNKAFMRSLGLE